MPARWTAATDKLLSSNASANVARRRATDGVVDEVGRVFDASPTGARPFHNGLYITDGSRIPTALGVNPSLTIAALALRTADKIIDELPASTTPKPVAASAA